MLPSVECREAGERRQEAVEAKCLMRRCLNESRRSQCSTRLILLSGKWYKQKASAQPGQQTVAGVPPFPRLEQQGRCETVHDLGPVRHCKTQTAKVWLSITCQTFRLELHKDEHDEEPTRLPRLLSLSHTQKPTIMFPSVAMPGPRPQLTPSLSRDEASDNSHCAVLMR